MTTFEITFNEKSIVGKYLLLFLENNKKHVKVKDPTLMTKAELIATVEEAREQFKRGEYTVYDSEEFRTKYGLK